MDPRVPRKEVHFAFRFDINILCVDIIRLSVVFGGCGFLHSLNVCDHNFLSALNMIFRFSSHHSLDFIRSCRAYSVHFVIVCVLFVCLFIFSIFYLE